MPIKASIHVMIDIETFGLRPGAVIWQLAAVHFIPEQYPEQKMFRDERSWNIDIISAMEHGHIDGSTLKWWMDRGLPKMSDFVYSETALVQLDSWISNLKLKYPTAQLCVWAKGPAFDLVQLEWQYHARELKCPWSYRDHRDVRTILDIADVNEKDHTFGQAHIAIDDCKTQALAVGAAYHRLRLVPRGYDIVHTSSLITSDNGGGVPAAASTGTYLEQLKFVETKEPLTYSQYVEPPPFYDPEWDDPHEAKDHG